jgi:DNA mismatch repair protein MutS2
MIYPKTFEEKIGMTEIRAMLAAHCLSPLGKQRVTEMSFQTDAALLNEWHQQTGEFIRLMEEEDRFPDEGYYDLRPTPPIVLHANLNDGTVREGFKGSRYSK